MDLSGRHAPPELRSPETPAFPAVPLKSLMLVLVERLVPNSDQGGAHAREVSPTLGDDRLAFRELDLLLWGADIHDPDG